MPHKHKRKAGDAPDFDLPPTSRAAPLPVGKGKTAHVNAKSKKPKVAHVEGYGQDDTPKAFQRLMAFSQGGPNKKRSALDDGVVLSKKQKAAAKRAAQQPAAGRSDDESKPTMTKANATAEAKHIPKIQPGESMAEYSLRVDAALPLTGISKSGKKIAGAPDHRITKHEKRLKKLQAGWREEEARIRDKEAEEEELAEEERDEQALIWEDKTDDMAPALRANGKKSKPLKRKKVVGEVDNHSEDEWEALEKKREQRKGLHDVVHAPPTFSKVPREIFKVKNGAKVIVNNIPSAVGSLRKREELGEERKTIIDTYRELMAAKKDEGHAKAKA
ncbi:uncharacterized protein EKO05_0005278 [Ascochyta rabiei]|uniref:Uncharacterized protein n=1 Tax=Didymella rabiei TaxID=5454 RepID=A0A163L422_DIDRA|nr:uncharacterized protein EKO05_0005278 [Ascochyta rabiei]KZM27484.1 hypothetical protein ST47_g1347 [Ascochyta rabiei]UPX14806.1 hypothetical protein EKO05_0005278 [Ascochyta rabiei]